MPATNRSSPRPAASLLAALLALVWLGASPAAAKKPSDPDLLFNPLLGVDYSHWLLGPIVEMASEKEVEAYLALTSDQAAAAFIEAFWAQRNQGTKLFTDTPQQIYQARVIEADKRFTEAAFPGSRTDRGTIFVLYGEPDEREIERPRRIGDPAPEIWRYAKDAPPGLDGEKPKRAYRFIKIDDLTVFYGEHMRRHPRLRDSRRRPPG